MLVVKKTNLFFKEVSTEVSELFLPVLDIMKLEKKKQLQYKFFN